MPLYSIWHRRLLTILRLCMGAAKETITVRSALYIDCLDKKQRLNTWGDRLLLLHLSKECIATIVGPLANDRP
jgi:hypothetical protein